jgi:hypothetical protein
MEGTRLRASLMRKNFDNRLKRLENSMTRRRVLFTTGLLVPALRSFASVPGISIHGTLRSSSGQAALELNDQHLIYLTGDDATTAVLKDQRLWGADFEVVGHLIAGDPGHFEIDGIYKSALFVHRGAKRLSISYWCDTCSIRTYSPGNCVCCQNYTQLDLRESEQP